VSSTCPWPKWLPRAALAFGLLALLAPGSGAQAGEPLPDRLALVALLKDGQFATLEATLVGYQRRFEADHKAQWPAVAAFEAFANSDSALEPRLGEWIAKTPESYAAPLARGVFYDHLGWLSRGSRYAARTPERRFDEMKDFFALAKPDLERALALNPRLVIAYEMLADIAMAGGERSEVERILTAGLAQSPDVIALHQSFLLSLQPKWLGAPDDVRRYLAALKEHFPSVGSLGWFQGYDDFERGGRLLDEGKNEDALARFDRALELAPRSASFLSARAKALFNLGRYDEAAETLEPGLASSPQSAEMHAQMGMIRYYQKRDAESLASLDKAIALDRLNPHYLYLRALTLEFLGRYEEAVRDLDAAMTYGANDATIEGERSRALSHFQARLDDAVAAARRATKLSPGSSVAWLRYAEALFFKQDCNAEEALQLFHGLCKHDGQCEAEQQDSAHALIRFMQCHKT
jgi:tetratricopeptide (TPR) repeat protein